MAREKDILGVSNLLTDLEVCVLDEDLIRWNLRKSDTIFLKPQELTFKDRLEIVKKVPGGASANTIVCASHLCLTNDGLVNRNGLVGALGDDKIGDCYKKATLFTKHNGKDIAYIIDYTTSIENGESGYCLILVSPDGERTLLPQLGVAPNFQIPLNKMGDFKYIHLTGYEVIANESTIMKAIEYAYKNGVKISFDLAEHNIVKNNPKTFREIGRKSEIMAGNEFEAKAYIGLDPVKEPEEYNSVDPRYVIEEMNGYGNVVIMKRGENGSLIKITDGPIIEIPVRSANIVSTTGAGDAYHGGFLYAIINGYTIEYAGRLGSELGARCCEVYGGRVNFC
jgi:sugar/nucleoside kinase (ribokinase family)